MYICHGAQPRHYTHVTQKLLFFWTRPGSQVMRNTSRKVTATSSTVPLSLPRPLAASLSARSSSLSLYEGRDQQRFEQSFITGHDNSCNVSVNNKPRSIEVADSATVLSMSRDVRHETHNNLRGRVPWDGATASATTRRDLSRLLFHIDLDSPFRRSSILWLSLGRAGEIIYFAICHPIRPVEPNLNLT